MKAITLTYYLDFVSSWCYYFEPVYAALQEEYRDQIAFDWQCSLIPPDALPQNRAEELYYYQRSGTVTRRTQPLNPDWFEPERREYLTPHLVAEAARDLGTTDDRVRLALARAALEEGRKVGQLEVALEIGAAASPHSVDVLRAAAQVPTVEERVRKSGRAFDALQVDQRPTFVLQSRIGDRAVFSGLIHQAPLEATIKSMLEDIDGYDSFHAHVGTLPQMQSPTESNDQTTT